MTEQFLLSAKKREKRKSQKDEKLDIENPFVKFAKSKGCIAFKLIILNKRGFPDRTVLCPEGKIFFIEFKRKNKKPNPIQIKIRNILENLGFKYYVCDELGQAENILIETLGSS